MYFISWFPNSTGSFDCCLFPRQIFISFSEPLLGVIISCQTLSNVNRHTDKKKEKEKKWSVVLKSLCPFFLTSYSFLKTWCKLYPWSCLFLIWGLIYRILDVQKEDVGICYVKKILLGSRTRDGLVFHPLKISFQYNGTAVTAHNQILVHLYMTVRHFHFYAKFTHILCLLTFKLDASYFCKDPS